MNRAFVLAARNLTRSPRRSLFLLAFLCAGFLSITLIRAGYADLFARVKESTAASRGELCFSLSGERGMSLGEYDSLKAELLSTGRFKAAKAVASVQGLAGTETKSAPVSGIAIEGAFADPFGPDGSARAELGAALADSLGLGEGDSFSGFVNDVGLSFTLEKTVRTEAIARDRFFLRMPLEALRERDDAATVNQIQLWFADGAKDRAAIMRDTAAMPALSAYTASAYELGNTEANSIVGVYEDSYGIVLIVVAATMLLALVNVLLLSTWERGLEWGTMLAVGESFVSVGAVIFLEAIILALAAGAAGGLLTIAISAAANASGGIRLPPPPTATEPMVIGLRPQWSAFTAALCVSLCCGAAASLAAMVSLRGKPIVELLFERN